MLKLDSCHPPFLAALLFFFLWGCQPSANNNGEETPGSVAVTWELVSNFTEGGYTGKFTINNQSGETLTDKNWTLFFSMSPSEITATDDPQPAQLEHLNGDWYKLSPLANFNLPVGDSVEVYYQATEARIKQTDQPLGLYMVYYNKEGEQKVKVEDYSIVPLTRKEQLLRGEEDQEEPASPEKTYQENEALSLLPKKDLLPIIPSPIHFTSGKGTFALDINTIHYSSYLLEEAQFLQDKLSEMTGRGFSLDTNQPGKKAIRLEIDSSKNEVKAPEGYHLAIDKRGITISGMDAAGVFYGIQSLLSLFPPGAYLQHLKYPELPYATVDDAPRFPFRSLHVDVARNFQSKETVFRVLDLMAHYKLNHFLFYTSEDEGWRVEIPGLPELTEVGGRRQHVEHLSDPALHPSYGSGPTAYAKGTHGSGYYTRADFIEILKYANKRHITVIPELNFPGHARAAIKSMEARYQRLMEEGKEEEANEYRLIDPKDQSQYLSAQMYKDNVVNVSRASAFHFFEKVVDEFDKMYQEAGLKMKIFHVGGDEVAESAWSQSPEALALLKKHPEIKDPQNLQAYFLRELSKRLQSRGLEIHGWEEVALTRNESGNYDPNPEFVDQNVVPYIWNNLFDYPDLGYRLANFGYDVVLCNVSNFYFDLAYNNDPQEPGAYWGGFNNTKNAWAFAPFNMFNTTFKNSMGKELFWDRPDTKWEQLNPDAQKHILGLEGQLWAETIKGRDTLEYYMLPKLLGFAESAWSPERDWETESNRDRRIEKIEEGWNVFANTIARREFPMLGKMNGGYHYRIPPAGATVKDGKVWANVALPGIDIRYTTDGSEPKKHSAIYSKPIKAEGIIKFKTFDINGQSGRTITVRN